LKAKESRKVVGVVRATKKAPPRCVAKRGLGLATGFTVIIIGIRAGELDGHEKTPSGGNKAPDGAMQKRILHQSIRQFIR
jgi:hypothetical protein